MKKTDVLIVGAGMGGLAAAALWAKKGSQVTLVESHYATGGCAGYFKRREGYYDVGATTLSGLKEGRPTARLIKELDLDIELYPCDPGIVVHFDHEKFYFYKEPEKLIAEIKRVFALDFRSTLNKWISIEEKLWSSLSVARPLSMLTLKDVMNLFFSQSVSLIFHPELFYKTFYDILPQEFKSNTKFIQCLDQLLKISTQQDSQTCPAFMGILGFLYPMDTYAIKGGMYGLCRSLEDKITSLGGDISLRNPCLSIERDGEDFIVQTKKGSFRAKKIISNIAPEIFNELYRNEYQIEQENDEIWGSLSAYFSFNSKKPVEELYHQIHFTDKDNNKKESLFFSFSHPKDDVKSSTHQMVTVSTHIDKNDFSSRGESYKQLKDEFQAKVLKIFAENFKSYEITEIQFDSVGTPLTFKDYTSRPGGEVGGLIHQSVLSLNRLIPNQLAESGLYYTGDYSFPGQGIVSVIQSAFNTLD